MASESTNGHKKLSDALQVLNDAATEKKEEIQGLLNDRYKDLRTFVRHTAASNRKAIKKFRRSAEDLIEEGQERITDAATNVDKNVRKNPWAYIGTAAGVAIVVGFLMGRSNRRD